MNYTNQKLKTLQIASTVLALSIFTGLSYAQIEVDPDLPSYNKTGNVSGNLNSIGSDTLNNLMTFWAEAFRKHHADINIQIEGKGSSTAPPALIAGTAQLGPMSRKMKKEELERFEDKYGFEPTRIGMELDSLAVYVNKDNPIDSLSLQQVDAVFSKTRKGGHDEDIATWGQLGLAGMLSGKPISLYGRNSASGTYGYFKKKALFKGDYKDRVKEQPGSASVVLGVTEDLAGIGYSGIGYKTLGVKAIGLSKKTGETTYKPSYENVLKGNYPLGRMLYVYVAKKPGQPFDAMTKEFLKLVLSKKGQEIVVKDGSQPRL
ncbi:MAG: phosphate ABC transporter substrate-binding protein PstS family protein [Kiritimatiellae bacterium]|nr:phosphate ABC transporter substrate-binding protein PstS family protein [Kiritimatiellia bacterium]